MSSVLSRNLTSCIRLICAGLLPAAVGGCALFAGNPVQQVEVHAFLGEREVAGVGCMLANDLGRWTVVAPGRVGILRSRQPLSVDCVRQGTGSLAEQREAPADLARLAARVRISAEGGYYADGRPGGGFSYPATLGVALEGPRAADPLPAAATPVF